MRHNQALMITADTDVQWSRVTWHEDGRAWTTLADPRQVTTIATIAAYLDRRFTDFEWKLTGIEWTVVNNSPTVDYDHRSREEIAAVEGYNAPRTD